MDTYKKILEGDLAWPSDVRVSVESGPFAVRVRVRVRVRNSMQQAPPAPEHGLQP